MKFTTNTKPLVDALNLGIINSNVSNYHKKSSIVQISADANTLKINIEASMICTEIQMKGSGEGDAATIFVDSLLFKQLMSTIDTPTVSLNIADDGLRIESGKSKFTLAKALDSSDFELNAPKLPDSDAVSLDIDKSDWKFVKDYQMYAISMAFVYPVYTRVWIGDQGDVLVGDYATSHFTHSKKSKLGTTCLLTDTIINLFNSLPDGAKITKSDNDYLIQLNTDSYSYLTQFTPQYESDPEVGSYNSQIFLGMMDHPADYNTFVTATVTKLLNQALLLSTTNEDTIKFRVSQGNLFLEDKNVDGQIPMEGSTDLNYEVEFKLETLKKVISDYPDEKISFAPMFGEDSTSADGVKFWNGDMTTILAGVE